MLIAIDAITLNLSQKTGVEWYAYYLIKQLIKIPSKNKFILYSSSKLNLDLPANWENKVLSWPCQYFWSQLRLSLEMIREKPDVLFVPVRALPFFCTPKKSVFTIHDLGYEVFPEAYSFWQRNYTRFVYQFAAKKACKIFVPSEFTKRELVRLCQTDSQKIIVTPLGYNKEIFNTNKDKEKNEEVLKKYGIKKPYLFYLGRKEKKKNILGLIKAFKILQNKLDKTIYLVLAGRAGTGYEEIKKEILQTKNIKEISYIETKDLPSLYQEAEIFVFPSFYEGFGLPLLEAMACGCPVVAARAGSLPEIGEEAVIYFNPDDINDIAEKIEMVLTSQNLKDDLKRKGMEKVKDFSWEKCARETMKALESA